MTKIKCRWGAAIFALCGWIALNGCSDDGKQDTPGKEGGDGGSTPPVTTLGGYADPNGVLVLNQGARMVENSSITYIAPDDTVEEDVYRTANGSDLGNHAQDLWMYDGKIYMMSDNTIVPETGEAGDGRIVVADAQTLRREKTFGFDDLTFPAPEESAKKGETLTLGQQLKNIAVIDEHNVFLSDSQGLFRLDITTGEMTIVTGSYALGNSGSTIETVVSTRGMTVIGDKLYCGGSGFWLANPKLFEFTRDKEKAPREIDLSGEFISGICRTGDHEIVVATCGRTGETKSFLTFVDTDTWTVTQQKQIKADLSANLLNSSGVTLSGDYLYFSAGSFTVSRLSLKTWKVEEYIQVSDDVPTARYTTCNVVADPTKNRLYVAVSNDWNEMTTANGNLLAYDCSGDQPRLVMNIENKTSYPVNIYPMSRFY